MISEGSSDTEDWNNDAENSGSHHRNKLHLKYIQTENGYLKKITILLYFFIK